MQDLPHNGAQRHLCKLYQNLPPRPRRGVHSPRQILLWLRGRHSEQPVSLTGWTHPGHRHTLWLCSPHRISHAASQLTSADLTHHLLLCVCGHECMRERESVCVSVCVRVCVCVCVCVLACSAVTPICATFSGCYMCCNYVWVLQCSACDCWGLKSKNGFSLGSRQICVVHQWALQLWVVVPIVYLVTRDRLSQQFAALLWLDPCFVASLWNRVTGQDLTCREGCGAGCPGWNVCCQFAAFPDSVCLAHKLHNRTSDVHGEPISFWSQGYGACHRWSAVSISGLLHKCLLCFCILYGVLILSFICEIRTIVMNKLVCRCWMGYFCLWFCLLWHLGSINWVNCVDSFCSTDAYVMLSYKMS